MPIENTFDPAPGMLSPAFAAPPVPGFPETVIITFNQRMIDFMLEDHEAEVISTVHAGLPLPIYKFTHQGKTLGIYRTGLGGSATVALMEEVISKGARRILAFGSCGTLEEGIDTGKLILPTAAYRDEGTSYHYLPASDYVSIPTFPILESIFKQLHLPYIAGKTWTTDAFYRETKGNAEKRRQDGCICVEMECASIMAAGQFRNVPVYQFLYGADSLSGDTWEARILGNTPDDFKRTLLTTALDVAALL